MSTLRFPLLLAVLVAIAAVTCTWADGTCGQCWYLNQNGCGVNDTYTSGGARGPYDTCWRNIYDACWQSWENPCNGEATHACYDMSCSSYPTGCYGRECFAPWSGGWENFQQSGGCISGCSVFSTLCPCGNS